MFDLHAYDEQLKPCPFCGEKAEVVYEQGWYKVGCCECWCQTQGFHDLEDAIKAWNKRINE